MRVNVDFKKVLLFLILSSCSQAYSPEKEGIMDRIESGVELPNGAKRLDDYARYYSTSASGSVVATYTTVVLPNVRFHDLPTGKRRWVNDSAKLPNLIGGGCSTVHVVFYVDTGAFGEIACNGSVGH